VTTLYKSLSYTEQCSQSRTSQRCLVTYSNSGRSSAPGLNSLQAGGHLTQNSHWPDFFIGLRLNWCWPSSNLLSVGLHYIATERIAQKTQFPTILLLLRDVSAVAERCSLLHRLATGDVFGDAAWGDVFHCLHLCLLCHCLEIGDVFGDAAWRVSLFSLLFLCHCLAVAASSILHVRLHYKCSPLLVFVSNCQSCQGLSQNIHTINLSPLWSTWIIHS
jgi:hypothetical protein